ncbi:hypothetical protein AaE_012294, partial [Aphanomyces astaci]
VDGVNYTCDDLHMWLAPFTPHQVHSVTVEFNTMVTISLLRVWNYNKSRAHSFRGVKLVRVLLDGQEIFQGEIRQAPGILGAVDQCCEVILFTTDELVDGVNVTCDDTHMWLVPFEGGKAEVRVHLATETTVYGLDVWNYNKSAEDTYRGVKSAIVLIDNVVVATVALRKAPGHALFDFKQSIVLGEWALYRSLSTSSGVSSTYKTHVLKQDYEPPLLPSGFLFKFVMWSTWGDPYYVGLNGIELYDTRGDKLPPPTLVAALPTGLADVQVKQDIRVVQNLFQGINNTWDAAEAWLAPLASSLGQCDGMYS